MDTMIIENASAETSALRATSPALDPAIRQQIKVLTRRAAHLHAAGNLVEVEACLLQVLELVPDEPQALYNLGILHRDRGELGPAERNFRKLIAIDKDFIDAYQALGELYYSTRQLLKAIHAYELGLKQAPTRLPLLAGLLVARLAERIPAEIKAVSQRILEIEIDNPDANTFLAWALLTTGGSAAEALVCAERAERRDRSHAQASSMKHECLLALGRTEEAETLWLEMQAKAKNDWGFAKNAAMIATQLPTRSRLVDLVRIYIESHPEDGTATGHLATMAMMEGDFEAGHELTKQVVAVLPNNTMMKMMQALTAFRMKEFDLFHELHWTRWHRDGSEKMWDLPVPNWDGQTLTDKAVLIYSEQGIGDHVMWASAIPAVKSHAPQVIFETNARLNSLFARSFPEYAVVTRDLLPKNWNTRAIGGKASAADVAHLLKVDMENLPGRAGFLIPEPQAMLKMRHRYQALFPGKKLIGISWRSGNRDSAAIRSLELASWAPIFAIADCAFINLQYGDVSRDIAFAKQEMGVEIYRDMEIDALGNMDPFAAQIAALDMVISVDNSTIHFAGALGKPTWALLPVNSDWRWLTKQRDTLWYKTLELFRQQTGDGWDPIVAEIAERLAQVSPAELKAAEVEMLHRCGAHAFKHARLDIAEDFYRALLQSGEYRAEALSVIGHCARVAGHAKDAVAITAGAVELDPAQIDYRAELALALDACGEGERGIKIARDALRQDGNNPRVLLAMGGILSHQGRLAEATDYFARVLRTDPAHIKSRTSLAAAQAAQGEWELASTNFSRAISYAPLNPLPHIGLAEAALRGGEFSTAWEHYRWRFGSGFGDLPPHLAVLDPDKQPETWDQGNLRRARLILRAERTPLEQLLLLSLIPDIVKETRSILAEVDPLLLLLVQAGGFKADFAVAGSTSYETLQAGKISLASSLGDLARRFRGAADAFPGQPWLALPDHARTAELRREYMACFPGRKLVGLAWRGGEGDDRQALTPWQPLLARADLGVVAVQANADRAQLSAFVAETGHDLVLDARIDGSANLVDYATQLAAMDLVIAVDDLTAVLAMALGRPVWKIASGATDHWCWGTDGKYCIWARHARILRTRAVGDSGIDLVMSELTGFESE